MGRALLFVVRYYQLNDGNYNFLDNMNFQNRIIINTVVSYTRTVMSVALTLFSSRWVLEELGISDFGVFSLIGTLMMFIMFLNNTLSNSDSRFFAIEIGKNDNGKLSPLFKSAFVMHFLLSILLVIVALPIGEYLIKYVFTLEQSRIESAIMVFRLSLCSSFVAMIIVPYTALFISFQNIVSVSILQMVQTILTFLLAMLLPFYGGDKLIFYAFFYSLIQVIVYLLYVLIGTIKYQQCRDFINSKVDILQIKAMFMYTIWNLFGDLGHLIRTQGASIVVNLLFGTSGNASMGIANQISLQSSNLTNSLNSSTAPEIFRRVGDNDLSSAVNLSNRVNKIGLYFILVIAVPVICFIDNIIDLWLVDVPSYCERLCCCFLVMYIIEKFTIGNLVILQAVNKIRKVQILVFIGYSLTPFLPFLGLFDLFNLTGIGISCIVTMLLTRVFIMCIYRRSFKIDSCDLIGKQIIPTCTLVCIALLSRSYLFTQYNEILVLAFKMLLVAIATAIFLFYALMNKHEQRIVLNKIKINKRLGAL